MSKNAIDLKDISTIKNLNIGNIKVDATDPNNISSKVVNEKDTRKRFLATAREMGCERQMLMILTKYDTLLRNCTNAKEREDISKLGVLEVYRLLGGGGELYVNGELVVKDD
jgi:hypothetical protein